MVAFNPNMSHCLLAAVIEADVVLITTGLGDHDSTELTDSLLDAVETSAKGSDEDSAWRLFSGSDASTTRFGSKIGPRVLFTNKDTVASVTWHYKGDYIAVLCPQSGTKAVSIHQISKAKSQYPFSKTTGKIQAVDFHPSRPFLFIATQQSVKIYNLVEQKLVKKLQSGCKWLSSMCVHHTGDHIILGKDFIYGVAHTQYPIGSFDRRVVWFDLDFGSTPYKTLKFHDKAVRAVSYHR